MRFEKLLKPSRYTDIICVGLDIKSVPCNDLPGASHEVISGFNLLHLKPKRNRLFQVCDPITVEDHTLFDTVINYVDTWNRTLIVSNHTLPLLGSSDFVDLLQSGHILLREGISEIYDESSSTSKTINTIPFVVSCPPTIVMFNSTNSGYSYTLVDISNYGIQYMADIWDNLDGMDSNLIGGTNSNNYAPGDSTVDCVLIARFMQEYYGIQAENKMGGIALTYSSQGMRFYRHRFFNDDILPHENVPVRILEGNCYTGGRVEERYHGYHGKKSYLLDARSLYPFIGSTRQFPTELLESTQYLDPSRAEEWVTQGVVFADCHVDTDQPIYPLRGLTGLKWPVGSFRTFLCADEFDYALRSGHVKKIYFASLYKTGYVLKEYSEYMLSLRSLYKQKKLKLSEYIVKVITNGLYGKMGQQGHYWQIVNDVIPSEEYGGFYRYDKETRRNEQYRVIDGVASKLMNSMFIPNTFTPISATINSMSRFYLWNRMKRAGLENVLYCCVDGLIVNRNGYTNLSNDISDNEHAYGMLKVAEEGNSCNIMGHGIYQIGNKIAYQGRSRYNERRYTGFWSVNRGINDVINADVKSGHSVVNQPRIIDDRGDIIFNRDVPGNFIYPENLSEQMLDTLPELLKMHSAYAHSPEWLE